MRLHTMKLANKFWDYETNDSDQSQLKLKITIIIRGWWFWSKMSRCRGCYKCLQGCLNTALWWVKWLSLWWLCCLSTSIVTMMAWNVGGVLVNFPSVPKGKWHWVQVVPGRSTREVVVTGGRGRGNRVSPQLCQQYAWWWSFSYFPIINDGFQAARMKL